MNKIQRHYPEFIDRREPPEVAAFDSVEELLSIPWVKSWADRQDFHRFSSENRHLMAELKGGAEWWVVGIAKEPIAGLPEWKS